MDVRWLGFIFTQSSAGRQLNVPSSAIVINLVLIRVLASYLCLLVHYDLG